MIEFCDGKHEVYTAVWNDPEAIGKLDASWHRFNTTSHITDILLSSKATLQTQKISSIVASDEERSKLWILKGFHQNETNMGGAISFAHITASYNGFVYHINFAMDSSNKPIILNVTVGEKKHDTDMDGFQVAKPRKKRG